MVRGLWSLAHRNEPGHAGPFGQDRPFIMAKQQPARRTRPRGDRFSPRSPAGRRQPRGTRRVHPPSPQLIARTGRFPVPGLCHKPMPLRYWPSRRRAALGRPAAGSSIGTASLDDAVVRVGSLWKALWTTAPGMVGGRPALARPRLVETGGGMSGSKHHFMVWLALSGGVVAATDLGAVSPVAVDLGRDLDVHGFAVGLTTSVITGLAAVAGFPAGRWARGHEPGRLFASGLVLLAGGGIATGEFSATGSLEGSTPIHSGRNIAVGSARSSSRRLRRPA